MIAESQPSSRSDRSGAAQADGSSSPTLKAAGKSGLRSGIALALIAAASLGAATLITACETLTVDFVYVASNKAAGANQYGEIDVFEINSESGRMRQIPTSPFPSGGRNPVAEAVSTDYQNLFVVNHDDNTIVQFQIGSDGKLYPANTVNTPGIFPLAVAASKSNLFVVDNYQPLPLCSTANPCSGSISVYPLVAPSGSCVTTVCMGTPANNVAVNAQYWPLTLASAPNDIIVPTAVNVVASGTNSYVYVTAYDSSTPTPVGYVFGFSVAATGVLTAVPNSPAVAGIQPSAIASGLSTGGSSTVYITDSVQDRVLGYTVSTATSSLGSLIPMTTGIGGTNRFAAGNQPSAIAVDPSYSYAYVTNSTDSTVTAYSISSSGALTQIANYATGLQPVAIGIDPSTYHFLFTVNFLDNTVSDYELSTTAGTLLVAQDSPFATSAQPVAAAAVPHNGTGAGIQSQ